MMPRSGEDDKPDEEIVAALLRMQLIRAREKVEFRRLTGGVSSDIWCVTAPSRRFCVKRALAKLKVMQDWRAPVERSRYEWDWLKAAGAIVPEAVPGLLGFDADVNLFALEWLDPGEFRWWKGELRDGRAEPADAAEVGRRLGRIHAGTSGRSDVAACFPTDQIFLAIRLEPYLLATARAHPGLAAQLVALVERTAATKHALVHGDVSPKNILVGPRGPVFLDAECAWYGDPAFDVAFCLNHLLLKCLWSPPAREKFLASYDALFAAYREEITWEDAPLLEARVASLLPALLLARVDGKSPVEYLTKEAERVTVRRVARHLLERPPERVSAVRLAWEEEIAG